MKTRPWFPFYVGDYLKATTHLSATESGAYLHLLCHHWEHGSVPDKTSVRARIAKVGLANWSKIEASLRPFFTVREDGTWVQSRMVRELARAESVSESRKTAASARYLASRYLANGKNNNEINGRSLQLHTQSQSHSEEQEKQAPRILDFASAGPEEKKEGFGYSSFDGSVSFSAAEIAALGLKFYTLTNVYGFIRQLAETDWAASIRPADRKSAIISKIRKTHNARVRDVAPDKAEQQEAARQSIDAQQEDLERARRVRERLSGGRNAGSGSG